MTEPYQCRICNTETTKICGGCKRIHYCSKECQKADLPLHRRICRHNPFNFVEWTEETRAQATIFFQPTIDIIKPHITNEETVPIIRHTSDGKGYLANLRVIVSKDGTLINNTEEDLCEKEKEMIDIHRATIMRINRKDYIPIIVEFEHTCQLFIIPRVVEEQQVQETIEHHKT